MNPNDPVVGCTIAAALAVAGCLAVVATPWRRETVRHQCVLFLVAFAVRFALSLTIYNTSLGTALGDEDASGWYGGVLLESAWRMNGVGLFDLPEALLDSFHGINRGYAYWLGLYFYITGAPDRLVAAALSCLCGALTVVFAYRTALALDLTPRGAARVGWLVCFFPSMLIWSALTVKEPVVILLEMLGLYAGLRLRLDGFSARHALLCAAAILLLTTLRFYAAYIEAAVVLASLAMPRQGTRRWPLIVAVFVAVALVAMVGRSAPSGEHGQAIEKFANMERLQNFRQGMASSANSGFGTDIDTGTSTGLLVALSLGWAFLLLAPFPWQLGGGSVRLALTLPEQLVWWVLFFTSVLPGTVGVVRRRLGDVLPVVLFLGCLGLVYSVTITNVGTLYRERAQFLPYLLVFASLHWDERRKRRERAGLVGQGVAR